MGFPAVYLQNADTGPKVSIGTAGRSRVDQQFAVYPAGLGYMAVAKDDHIGLGEGAYQVGYVKFQVVSITQPAQLFPPIAPESTVAMHQTDLQTAPAQRARHGQLPQPNPITVALNGMNRGYGDELFEDPGNAYISGVQDNINPGLLECRNHGRMKLAGAIRHMRVGDQADSGGQAGLVLRGGAAAWFSM